MISQDLHGTGARAALVNRTHRVVRERATAMRRRRREVRDLILPLLICSAVLLVVGHAVWTVFAQGGFGLSTLQAEAGRLFGAETAEAGGTGSLLLLWFVPVSVVALALVFLRRKSSSGTGPEAVR